MAQYLFSFFRFFYRFQFFFKISNFFGVGTTDETWFVEMCICCMKIGIVLVLYFKPWVEASAGGLLVPKGLFNPVAKYFSTCLKYELE
jgi:hypothetical protein